MTPQVTAALNLGPHARFSDANTSLVIKIEGLHCTSRAAMKLSVVDDDLLGTDHQYCSNYQ